MYDVIAHPDSPVDSSMFPAVYDHTAVVKESELDQVLSVSVDSKVGHAKTLPSLIQVCGPSEDLKEGCIVYDCELEPFEYRPGQLVNTEDLLQKDTSLCSVFGDQDLVDAIFSSLDAEQAAAQQQQQQHLLALGDAFAMHSMSITIPAQPTVTMAMPCIRKPGTFLNKDGRWIKGKPCRMENCDKRAQSNGLCKGHGGGARCSKDGCSKSSQGGGFCRAHGGGKRCMFEGCEKGTQRNGFCYLHGGVRSCCVEGCDKKDRGNGKCFSHGGGRKCQAPYCTQTLRRGTYCDSHAPMP